ncbi:pheromone precursor [Trametes sanguinea]|nr:pheromone precursor [Trametes sanguinea]
MDDFTDITSFSTILDSMAATSQESSDATPFLGPDGIPVDMEYVHGSSSYSWCVVA